MRCGATRATPVMMPIGTARPAANVSSVGCTVSRLDVILTSVPRGTATKSAPIRENAVVIPALSAQPATKLANPMPTPTMTASARRTARNRRRPTFCAANLSNSQSRVIALNRQLPLGSR